MNKIRISNKTDTTEIQVSMILQDTMKYTDN